MIAFEAVPLCGDDDSLEMSVHTVDATATNRAAQGTVSDVVDTVVVDAVDDVVNADAEKTIEFVDTLAVSGTTVAQATSNPPAIGTIQTDFVDVVSVQEEEEEESAPVLDMCVLRVDGSDGVPVVAACPRLPDDTCPAVFSDRCYVLAR